MVPTRLRRTGKTPRLLPALLLTLVGACSSPLPAARAANVIQSVSPVLIKGQPVAYDITLSSGTEFPMRDEVLYLSIGGRQFINSHYLQGGTLNTVVFRLSPGEFAGLKNGDPVVAFYSAEDAANPEAQWAFGRLRLLTPVSASPRPVTGVTERPVTVSPEQPAAAPVEKRAARQAAKMAAKSVAKKGQK